MYKILSIRNRGEERNNNAYRSRSRWIRELEWDEKFVERVPGEPCTTVGYPCNPWASTPLSLVNSPRCVRTHAHTHTRTRAREGLWRGVKSHGGDSLETGKAKFFLARSIFAPAFNVYRILVSLQSIHTARARFSVHFFLHPDSCRDFWSNSFNRQF